MGTVQLIGHVHTGKIYPGVGGGHLDRCFQNLENTPSLTQLFYLGEFVLRENKTVHKDLAMSIFIYIMKSLEEPKLPRMGS